MRRIEIRLSDKRVSELWFIDDETETQIATEGDIELYKRDTDEWYASRITRYSLASANVPTILFSMKASLAFACHELTHKPCLVFFSCCKH